jgi:hypothetical protein
MAQRDARVASVGERGDMVTVRIERRDLDGSRVVARITARDIATAARLTGGRVIFPLDPEEFFRGSGPAGFHTIEEVSK